MRTVLRTCGTRLYVMNMDETPVCLTVPALGGLLSRLGSWTRKGGNLPRISREAVTRREALARTLFKGGKTPEEVQAAMIEVDVGGGRKGLKMESGRLAELARAHAPKKTPNKDTDEQRRDTNSAIVGVSKPVPSLVPDMVHESVLGGLDDNSSVIAPGGAAEEGGSASVAAPDSGTGTGIIRAHQCRVGITYTDLELPSLVGVFTGTHGGLYCFQMNDGRVFKLYNNDKVREKVREAT